MQRRIFELHADDGSLIVGRAPSACASSRCVPGVISSSSGRSTSSWRVFPVRRLNARLTCTTRPSRLQTTTRSASELNVLSSSRRDRRTSSSSSTFSMAARQLPAHLVGALRAAPVPRPRNQPYFFHDERAERAAAALQRDGDHARAVGERPCRGDFRALAPQGDGGGASASAVEIWRGSGREPYPMRRKSTRFLRATVVQPYRRTVGRKQTIGSLAERLQPGDRSKDEPTAREKSASSAWKLALKIGVTGPREFVPAPAPTRAQSGRPPADALPFGVSRHPTTSTPMRSCMCASGISTADRVPGARRRRGPRGPDSGQKSGGRRETRRAGHQAAAGQPGFIWQPVDTEGSGGLQPLARRVELERGWQLRPRRPPRPAGGAAAAGRSGGRWWPAPEAASLPAEALGGTTG